MSRSNCELNFPCRDFISGISWGKSFYSCIQLFYSNVRKWLTHRLRHRKRILLKRTVLYLRMNGIWNVRSISFCHGRIFRIVAFDGKFRMLTFHLYLHRYHLWSLTDCGTIFQNWRTGLSITLGKRSTRRISNKTIKFEPPEMGSL